MTLMISVPSLYTKAPQKARGFPNFVKTNPPALHGRQGEKDICMKQKLNITLGGKELPILTSEKEAYVLQLAKILNSKIATLPGVRVETLLLLCLDLLDERVKEGAARAALEEEVSTLRAQIIDPEAGLSGHAGDDA